MFLLIVSPKPTPSVFSSLLSFIFVKAVNRLPNFDGWIPTPVSLTLSLIFASSTTASTVTDPWFVYFSALETRLIRICWTLFPSMRISVGKSWEMLALSSIFFMSALNFRMSMHSLMIWTKSVIWSMLRESWFASCYEKSKTSLTRNISSFPQLVATIKNFSASGEFMKFLRSSRHYRIELSGFLNSWAAEANAMVLSFCICFCSWSSIHWDMSLIVVMMILPLPFWTS